MYFIRNHGVYYVYESTWLFFVIGQIKIRISSDFIDCIYQLH